MVDLSKRNREGINNMETIMLYMIVVLVIVMGVGSYYIATDIKKKIGWLYLLNGTCGILLGLILGFLRGNIISGLEVGAIAALLYMFGGVIGRWQKQRFTELDHWYKERFKK